MQRFVNRLLLIFISSLCVLSVSAQETALQRWQSVASQGQVQPIDLTQTVNSSMIHLLAGYADANTIMLTYRQSGYTPEHTLMDGVLITADGTRVTPIGNYSVTDGAHVMEFRNMGLNLNGLQLELAIQEASNGYDSRTGGFFTNPDPETIGPFLFSSFSLTSAGGHSETLNQGVTQSDVLVELQSYSQSPSGLSVYLCHNAGIAYSFEGLQLSNGVFSVRHNLATVPADAGNGMTCQTLSFTQPEVRNHDGSMTLTVDTLIDPSTGRDISQAEYIAILENLGINYKELGPPTQFVDHNVRLLDVDDTDLANIRAAMSQTIRGTWVFNLD